VIVGLIDEKTWHFSCTTIVFFFGSHFIFKKYFYVEIVGGNDGHLATLVLVDEKHDGNRILRLEH
jgi:hypothetical protein